MRGGENHVHIKGEEVSNPIAIAEQFHRTAEFTRNESVLKNPTQTHFKHPPTTEALIDPNYYARSTVNCCGTAPLSGFESSPVAPLWNRLGRFLYRHGEALYNFQGLRAYKEKFHPVWEPRYLAYPGGLRLPRVLADVAALIAGGYRRILLK